MRPHAPCAQLQSCGPRHQAARAANSPPAASALIAPIWAGCWLSLYLPPLSKHSQRPCPIPACRNPARSAPLAVLTAPIPTPHTPQGLNFGVFGLGNKQYEHFNAVGKRVHKALAALGAAPLLACGLGDDDECIDDDFDAWCNNLLAALDAKPQLLGLASGGGEGEQQMPAWDVEVMPPGTASVAPFATGGSGRSHGEPLTATVGAVRELHTPASGRSCVHVELELPPGAAGLGSGGAGAAYEAGDHVAVHPANSDASVAAAAALLGLPLDTVFSLRPPPGPRGGEALGEPLPGPLSLRDALTYHADLLSSPYRDALLALASCASDEHEAARLRLLGSTSAEGKAEYASYISGPCRSLLEVMAAHPSARPGLGLFFGSVAPRLQPRFYSISSGPAAHPRAVHITCAVVRDAMPSGRLHEGVASTWLASRRPGDQLTAYLRHSNFKLPGVPGAPVIMVGPGTGLAPFRGFLQQRAAAAAAAGSPSAAGLGRAVLFFGCRHRGQDYIYQQELAAAVESGVLDELHVAFSREGAAKDYVQHRMAAAGMALWELLARPDAHLYVCGDAKHMARDVHAALVGLAEAHGGMSTAAAEAWVKALSDNGRYQKDVW